MERPAPIQLRIELEAGVEPLSGTVAVGEHAARRFLGWIELARAIELARSTPGPEGGGRAPADPTSPRRSPQTPGLDPGAGGAGDGGE